MMSPQETVAIPARATSAGTTRAAGVSASSIAPRDRAPNACLAGKAQAEADMGEKVESQPTGQ
jgi:hypothetical protein